MYIAFIFFINNLSADSIKLKNGTVLEGKIVEETAESITIEYKVTKSINDIKTVKRSEVLEIQKEPEDEKAFKKLDGILPTDDLLNAEEYDEIINGPLTEFLNNFPASKHKAKVQEVVDELKKEKALIEKGKSLLPVGILEIEGSFKRGDLIQCKDVDGNEIARGLSNFSSGELEKIKGINTEEIRNILGHLSEEEVIHRNNLVLS